MASSSNTPSSSVTMADHEVIERPNNLRKAMLDNPTPDDDDSIERAEKALAELSTEFSRWMGSECERLDEARQSVKTNSFTKANKDMLFRAAHDIKGEAATFGFPAVASAADSLCRLIEYAPDATKIPIELVDQHVDAVRAIIREHDRPDAIELARQITRRLRDVTDEFLVHENQGRTEILAAIAAPSLVPLP